MIRTAVVGGTDTAGELNDRIAAMQSAALACLDVAARHKRNCRRLAALNLATVAIWILREITRCEWGARI